METVPKILAVETSGKTFSLALAEASGLKAELFFDIGLRHSEILKDSCDFILKKCGMKKEELTHWAVSTGPGSFTGLRVGISFARAAAQALKVPLIGVPVFETVARGIGPRTGDLCVLIDSIGEEVYAGLFKGPHAARGRYSVAALPDLCARLQREKRNGKIMLAGEGFLRHEKEMRKALGSRVQGVERGLNFPRAGALAAIALEKARLSKSGPDSWKKIVPFYLRPPMAVERLGHRKK